MLATENAATTYSWMITFLIYNDIGYDKKKMAEVIGYIPMEWQKNRIYATVSKMTIHEKIKVSFIEVNIDENKISILLRSNTPGTIGLSFPKTPNITPLPNIFTNEESLSEILSTVMAENRAKNNVVVTIGHGSIYGINLQPDPSSNKDKKDTEYFFPEALHKFATRLTDKQIQQFQEDSLFAAQLSSRKLVEFDLKTKSYIKFFSPDSEMDIKSMDQYIPELKLSVLTLAEINQALLSSFAGNRVDVLVLDNCVMQNLFCQYDLSQSVEYLVAAQSGISFPGFNYVSMIKKIGDEMDQITPESVARHLVDKDTIRTHADYKDHAAHIENCWCLSAVRLDRQLFETLHERFSNLIEQFMLVIGHPDKRINREIPKIITSALNNLFNYAVYCIQNIKLIDFVVFLDFFIEKLEANNVLAGHKDRVLAASRELAASLHSITVYSFIGNQFYSATGFRDPGRKIGFGFLMPLKMTGNRFVDTLFQQKGKLEVNPRFFDQTRFYELIAESRARL